MTEYSRMSQHERVLARIRRLELEAFQMTLEDELEAFQLETDASESRLTHDDALTDPLVPPPDGDSEP